ncbi:DUF3861 domain-containing protein [Vibrio sp. WXL210]|uniref:DUF3861 domain-containing protein n=1 Tax=Vibrio sp. WXL210 TaxID=3450709 RepID=UPI003EC56C8F
MIPTIRKDKQYKVTIEEINVDEPRTLEFDYQDREDLFKIVESIKNGSGLEPAAATKVSVALRLLGPEMMKDRKHPLFADFFPHFKQFMQNLKQTVKSRK